MEQIKQEKASERTYYICSNCKTEHIRWSGRCHSCREWNTLQKSITGSYGSYYLESSLEPLQRLVDLDPSSLAEPRISTKIESMDRVLGGGLVLGSFVLTAGEPGVGKSTLLLEAVRKSGLRSIYFSGEESIRQIALRASRMGIKGENLFLSRETNLERIYARIIKEKPQLALIDSIQSIYDEKLASPGNMAQLRRAGLRLLEAARSSGAVVWAVGHITKDGLVAGPRFLEHMVDTVLYFDSDRSSYYRLLRSVKNRFGPAGETAVFEMSPCGLKPRDEFILSYSGKPHPGRTYSSVLHGNRPVLVEVQALTAPSHGNGRRQSEGLDTGRLTLIAAVLGKYFKEFQLSEHDIFTSLVGGFSSDDPGLDLAQCCSILSSYMEIPIHPKIACLGEIELAGEIRPVERLEGRIHSLQSAGFRLLLAPPLIKGSKPLEARSEEGRMKIYHLSHLSEILDLLEKKALS